MARVVDWTLLSRNKRCTTYSQDANQNSHVILGRFRPSTTDSFAIRSSPNVMDGVEWSGRDGQHDEVSLGVVFGMLNRRMSHVDLRRNHADALTCAGLLG